MTENQRKVRNRNLESIRRLEKERTARKVRNEIGKRKRE